ncbi:MAG: NADH-quinone oxidoreductase subunit M [Methanomassiliicoccales archaeon]|nr:MAG: NADH-quinone oxidoreductase subunit M [Methanomassiliicoccales archaeon]
MLENVPILSLLLVLPLIGALAAFMVGPRAKISKMIALGASAATLVLASLLMLEFFALGKEIFGEYQYGESYEWIKAAGINYILGVDGISVPMVWLTALLCFLAILFSWDVETRTSQYMGLMLVLEVGVLGVFMALDYFLFYVFWEVVLIPMYFLIAIWGGPRRDYASLKFFIYTHVASLVMLIGIFALYFEASNALGYRTFDMQAIATVSGDFSIALQTSIFAALLIGFITKMPMVPVHTWLPDAHVEAPTAGSVLLAGLLLKMGSYGIIRISLPSLHGAWDLDAGAYGGLVEGFSDMQVVMIVLGVLSMIYGAIMCIAQKDIKKMVAYSSISHMGGVMLAFSTFTEIGLAAGVFMMFAHGLITAVLFMMCGVVQHKTGTRMIPRLGGLAAKIPVAATFMMIGFMASLGLPGLVGFIAEFAIFVSTFEAFDWLLLVPIMSVALTAAYYIWAMQRVLFGPLTKDIDLEHLHDVSWYEAAPLAVLVFFIVLFGIWPALILDYITPAVTKVLMGGF